MASRLTHLLGRLQGVVASGPVLASSDLCQPEDWEQEEKELGGGGLRKRVGEKSFREDRKDGEPRGEPC